MLLICSIIWDIVHSVMLRIVASVITQNIILWKMCFFYLNPMNIISGNMFFFSSYPIYKKTRVYCICDYTIIIGRGKRSHCIFYKFFFIKYFWFVTNWFFNINKTKLWFNKEIQYLLKFYFKKRKLWFKLMRLKQKMRKSSQNWPIDNV